MSVTTDAENLAERSLGRLNDAAGAIAEDVKSETKTRLRGAKRAVDDAYGQTRDTALGAMGEAEGLLRDKALMAVGIVAGAGLLLVHREAVKAAPPSAAARDDMVGVI
jgi:ElaB/YqjD/DUF883 family membrane-anchored ribosome-binding protein